MRKIFLKFVKSFIPDVLPKASNIPSLMDRNDRRDEIGMERRKKGLGMSGIHFAWAYIKPTTQSHV